MSVWKEFRRPFNIISLLIGVTGIILFVLSKRDKEPAYFVSKDRNIVFDSKKLAPAIKLVDRDSTIISEDVFLATVSFWNAGELPITRADVLKPVRLVIDNCTRILDYKILAQKDSAIAGYTLQPDDRGMPYNSRALSIDWDILEPGYGLKLQVMYVGQQFSMMRFDGHIIGVRSFSDATPVTQKYQLMWWFFPVVLLVGFVADRKYFDLERYKTATKTWRVFYWGINGSWVFGIAIVIGWFLFTLYEHFFGMKPPF
jgi:hypothetical protein